MSNPGSRRSGNKAPGPGKGRSNRGRTVLTEKQRTILSACFQHNPKPDALLKVGAQFRQKIELGLLLLLLLRTLARLDTTLFS